jgi:hypothetical protein
MHLLISAKRRSKAEAAGAKASGATSMTEQLRLTKRKRLDPIKKKIGRRVDDLVGKRLDLD